MESTRLGGRIHRINVTKTEAVGRHALHEFIFNCYVPLMCSSSTGKVPKVVSKDTTETFRRSLLREWNVMQWLTNPYISEVIELRSNYFRIMMTYYIFYNCYDFSIKL